MSDKVIITNHARERFLQRSNKKYKHLEMCRCKNCCECEKLYAMVKEECIRCKRKINEDILQRLLIAKEEKSYLNNTNFTEWYYSKYGYDHIPNFMVHKEFIFIVKSQKGRKIIVTCISSKNHIVGKRSIKPKFKHAMDD